MLGDVALGLGLRSGVHLAEPPKAEAAAPSPPAPPPGEASRAFRPQLCSSQALHRSHAHQPLHQGPFHQGACGCSERPVKGPDKANVPGPPASRPSPEWGAGELVSPGPTQHGRGKGDGGKTPTLQGDSGWGSPAGVRCWRMGEGWHVGVTSPHPKVSGREFQILESSAHVWASESPGEGVGVLLGPSACLAAPEGWEGHAERQETGWERPRRAPRRAG